MTADQQVDNFDLSAVSRDDVGEPIFAEPWQAQAFALVLKLHQEGVFSWSEWTKTLSAEIKKAQHQGDPGHGETYYRHWLAALETLAIAKNLTDYTELAGRRDAWQRAAHATPHGQPIELKAADRESG